MTWKTLKDRDAQPTLTGRVRTKVVNRLSTDQLRLYLRARRVEVSPGMSKVLFVFDDGSSFRQELR